jgi:acyl-CoA synthetase (AMP-forming)/AMP-acid ligase II
MMNLSASLRYHATRTPDRTAIIHGDDHRSYAQLWERVQRLAGWLSARGIGENDVVAVFMKNSPTFLEIALATSHVGGIFLPVNFRLAREEAAYIFENAEAKHILIDEEFAPILGFLPDVVTVDASAQSDSSILSDGAIPIPEPLYRRPDDLFRLMYTSGTTDHPKGVMHTYSNYYWKNIDHVIALSLTKADRILLVGPLYHVGAFDLPGMAVLWVGGTVCILREFDEADVLGAIEREKLTGAWLAPVMLGRLLAYPERDRYDLKSFKWAIGGGEKTPESRIRAFGELFPNARYIDGYGLTETCSGDTLMEAGMEIEKIGSTGRQLAHCEVAIRDESGTFLAPRMEGEICVRGPKVTTGYWKDDAKTAASFFPERWFRTGDIGFLDEDGFLTITDRKKDMIISGGENIASSEVERVIYALPQVSEVAVIGVPDPKWGERPVAVVVPKPGQTLDLETLARHCREHLAAFKVPRQLYIRDALPRNPSGKVLKRTLRKEFASATN